jgi:hypothetical protein
MSRYTDYLGNNPSTKFVVMNIAPQRKRIKIFNYPIENNDVRDLLAIPEICEADIRASLLKGEILRKLKAKEIVVIFSDIDLLQFNDEHKAFLKASGITKGLEVDEDQLTVAVQIKLNAAAGSMPVRFHEGIVPTGAIDGSNRTYGTPDKFLNGAYLGSDYSINVRHNGRVLYPGVDYIVLESVPTAGYDTIVLITFSPPVGSKLICSYTSLP